MGSGQYKGASVTSTTGESPYDLMSGDKVKIGTPKDIREDDIIEFPEEHTGAKAIYLGVEEGSNIHQVQIESTEDKIFVYKHWIKKA